jgi:hypothetical protein
MFTRTRNDPEVPDPDRQKVLEHALSLEALRAAGF